MPSEVITDAARRNGELVNPRLKTLFKNNAKLLRFSEKLPARERAEAVAKVGDLFVEGVGNNSACKAGCFYCCKQSIMVHEVEAEIIAEFTGKKATLPTYNLMEEPGRVALLREQYTGVPCSFLDQGKCSIYPVRPFVCRIHFNIGDNPELCNTSVDNDVPMLNTQSLQAFAIITFLKYRYGDIRDFFPD